MPGVNHLFAGCAVADVAAAHAFYVQLFGREPDLVPNDREGCWQVTEGMWVYYIADAERAGRSVLTMLVDDLDAWLAEWASRGLAPAEMRQEAPGAVKAVLFDPDGNELGFGHVG